LVKSQIWFPAKDLTGERPPLIAVTLMLALAMMVT
jgi:hypothetical protein